MSKYHIDKNGKPALCRAKKQPCPLGEHFETEKAAYDNIQSQMSKEYGLLSIVNNNEEDNQANLKKYYNQQHDLLTSKSFSSREEEEIIRTRLAELSTKMNDDKDTETIDFNEILKDISKPDSGATISINKNNFEVTMPTTGFCASPYPQHSKVFDSHEDLDTDTLLEYIDNLDSIDESLLKQEDIYIGLWNDPETGKIYLDLSKRYHTAKDARIACEENDQIAYFDLQVFESVDVDRDATSGQTEMTG